MGALPILLPAFFVIFGIFNLLNRGIAGHFLFYLLLSVIFSGIICVNSVIYGFDRYDAKDYAYSMFPIFFYLLYMSWGVLFSSKIELVRIIVIYIVLSIFSVILQKINILNINEWLFAPLLAPVLESLSNESGQVQTLSDRPGGLIGNPVWCSYVVYLFSKSIDLHNQSRFYIYLSFFCSALCGARSVLAISILIELLSVAGEYFENDWGKIFKDINKNYLILIISSICFVLAIIESDVILQYISGAYSSVDDVMANDYSISYRLSMVERFWFNDSESNIVSGGFSWREFPKFVDSELVMRTMQFGVLGFLILKIYIPYLIIKSAGRIERVLSRRGKINAILFITLVVCLSSLTFTLTSAPYFIFVLSVACFVVVPEAEEGFKDEY
jgi:hypothetical protein